MGTALGHRLSYPSALFPPAPAVELDIPAEWTALPGFDALIAAADPDSGGGFRTNVTVVARRVEATDDPGARLAAAVEADAAAFADASAVVVDDASIEHEGLCARAVRSRATSRDGHAVEGYQLIVYVPSAPHVAHVVVVTGAAASAAAIDVVRPVVDSPRVPDRGGADRARRVTGAPVAVPSPR